MPPETIAGRYRIEREVGRGGMGAVWLCRDQVLGRRVAVKQVGRLPGESTTDLARAMREARSSAALNHRNVVAVYDAIEEGDHVWLVMEYVPGRTLGQIMAAEGPLPPERVAWIGAQVADGLAAAHQRGTVHRDVKPGNILVTDDDVAQISDFGIARTPGDPQVTQSGLVSGTPAYFSPEMARGEEASPAADVWALGATLYAAVEGRPAYPHQANALAMLATIARERPPAPTRAGVLTEPIGRMLDPDPASRWSMDDAAHALRRIHERHAASGTREDVEPPTVAVPAAVGAAAAPAGSAPTPTAAAPEAPPPSGTTTVEPAPAPRRRRGGALPALLVLLLLLLAGGGYLWWSSSGEESSPEASSSTGPTKSASPHTSPRSSPQPSPTSQSPSSQPTPSDLLGPAGSRKAFVEDYYGLLPSDTQQAWSLLSSDYQAQVGSYDDYRGFWDTIDAVSVDSTRPLGSDAMDVSLTYTRSDGSTASEVRRVFLERSGDSYLITGSSIVG